MATIGTLERVQKARLLTAPVAATTEGGDNTLISGVSEKKIVVLSYVLTGSKAGLLILKDSEGTQATISGSENGGAAYGGAVPAFICNTGKSLVLTTPASGKAYGHITYCLI